ncbi:RNA polymerase sigma-70 factor (ECF subfamily) [Arcicella rosea]|uniref:RNA polymerase sigma-70 factor n=1 Tax=Arcicella rosea TaxID=502909 RepID=UPI00345C982D
MAKPLLIKQNGIDRKALKPIFSKESNNSMKIISFDTMLRNAFEEDSRKAFELLFQKYYAPLCSHAVRFVYSKQIAEDLVSEVFYQFYKTEAHLNIKTSFVSYLFTAVRNEAFSHLKKEFGKNDLMDANTENTLKNSMPLPDAEVHFNQLFMRVNEVIGQLPNQCQKVFLLNRFENKRYQEIADELNISPRTVEVHMSKALKFLRSALHKDWLLSVLIPIFY